MVSLVKIQFHTILNLTFWVNTLDKNKFIELLKKLKSSPSTASKQCKGTTTKEQSNLIWDTRLGQLAVLLRLSYPIELKIASAVELSPYSLSKNFIIKLILFLPTSTLRNNFERQSHSLAYNPNLLSPTYLLPSKLNQIFLKISSYSAIQFHQLKVSFRKFKIDETKGQN